MSVHTSDAAPLIEGRYRIVGSLGEGGMAVVYRAWDTRLRAWRAVKFLLPEFARRKAIRLRFESEAYAMARLDHPNVVRVYDVGQAGDLPFIAMELVEGGSLDGWTARNGRMPQRQAIRAVIQVCAGLSAAHAEGIIHRDVKPGTSSWIGAGCARSPTSGSPRSRTRRPSTHAKARPWGPRASWRRSSGRTPARPTSAPTCSRPARPCSPC